MGAVVFYSDALTRGQLIELIVRALINHITSGA